FRPVRLEPELETHALIQLALSPKGSGECAASVRKRHAGFLRKHQSLVEREWNAPMVRGTQANRREVSDALAPEEQVMRLHGLIPNHVELRAANASEGTDAFEVLA